jgi:hypothetical protein
MAPIHQEKSMHIDRKLNLVCEFSRGEDSPLVVHSAALPTEVVETYFDWFGPATNRMVTEGYGHFAPRYAALLLKQVARRPLSLLAKGSEAYQQAEKAIEERLSALFNEMHRLTLVLACANGKWDMVPVDDAKAAGLISAEECSRIDAMLCFFTAASESVPLEDREATLGGLSIFHARTELLNSTEFLRSWMTLTAGGSSTASPAASPPSSPGSPPPKDSASSSNGSMRANSPAPGSSRKPTGIVFSSP